MISRTLMFFGFLVLCVAVGRIGYEFARLVLRAHQLNPAEFWSSTWPIIALAVGWGLVTVGYGIGKGGAK